MVMAGLEKLRHAGAEVNALVLVSKANVSRPREVYQWLKDQELTEESHLEQIKPEAIIQ